MPVYFASDAHLRLDRPERADRLARWVKTLQPDDRLYLVGDVCDFWYASRQMGGDPFACEGLKALAEFREAGGDLTLLVGNHDLWLGPFYETTLGAKVVPEPHVVEAYGLRFRLTHGHRAGGRQAWKAGMESHAFLKAFGLLPEVVARKLDRRLESSNEVGRDRDEARLVEVYRKNLETNRPDVDIVIFGHVHAPLDDRSVTPRLIILGGWHTRTCYLKVDETGVHHVVEPAANPSRHS